MSASPGAHPSGIAKGALAGSATGLGDPDSVAEAADPLLGASFALVGGV